MLALVLAVATTTTGCQTGRMVISDVPLEKIEPVGAPGSLRAGVRGLARLESSVYQSELERQLARSLEHAGLFASVAHGDFADEDVDLLLRVDKADVSFRRHVNLAYFPLALATLTIYIWVGGPIQTDEQFYDVTLHAEKPGGEALFSVTSTLKKDHWLNLYTKESWNQQIMCRGPHAYRMMNDLVSQLAAKLRGADLALARGATRPR